MPTLIKNGILSTASARKYIAMRTGENPYMTVSDLDVSITSQNKTGDVGY